eukprot:1601955-Amphidinium_carterae.1
MVSTAAARQCQAPPSRGRQARGAGKGKHRIARGTGCAAATTPLTQGAPQHDFLQKVQRSFSCRNN